jgi:hypothetical protein
MNNRSAYTVMSCDDFLAIDIHTQVEFSRHHPNDEAGRTLYEATEYSFGFSHSPTIAETYRLLPGRRIGLVIFSVCANYQSDRQRTSNQEFAVMAVESNDIMLASFSIDPLSPDKL